MLRRFFRVGRGAALLQIALLLPLITAADWRVDAAVPLGILYLLPMVIAGSAFTRSEVAALAVLCTSLAEAFDGFAWAFFSGVPRDVLYFTAFCGVGFFVYEVSSGRRAAALHLAVLEKEIGARRDAEEQLQVLVESSPIAIFTTDAVGTVILANDAAHSLFAAGANSLRGKPIGGYLPSLLNVPALREGRQTFRTVMQCRARRADGEVFIAEVWFSTYATSAGARMAAMVVDTSEELRDREEAGLHQLLAGSRILVGAVSHEIRNVCGAIALVYENLTRGGALGGNKDFQALGTLVLALEKIASLELRQTRNQAAVVELHGLLEELRIVVGPALREEQIELCWAVEPELPPVWADRQSLMQVFLNLVKNSEQAMGEAPARRLTVRAVQTGARVIVSFQDTGGGVAHPELLFRPFQSGAREAGLGLYLSRALMRSFGGDLRYEPGHEDAGEVGATFAVELTLTGDALERSAHATEDPALADR